MPRGNVVINNWKKVQNDINRRGKCCNAYLNRLEEQQKATKVFPL